MLPLLIALEDALVSDSQLHSIHLGDNPRRELFRQARLQLEGACGLPTLLGAPPLSESAPLDAPTRTISSGTPGGPSSFFLKDGDQLHALTVGVNTVGRLPDNNVILKDEHVSRRHCAVVVHTNGQCEVHDIASKNGTLLNGKKIAGPTRLRPGDQLLLCTKKLFLVSQASEAKPEAAVA
jgi:hypothetical protein